MQDGYTKKEETKMNLTIEQPDVALGRIMKTLSVSDTYEVGNELLTHSSI